VTRLAQHGAETAHLPHHPFDDLRASAQVLGQKAAALLREINQDCAALEHGDRRAAVGRIVIGDRGHPVVRADGEEFFIELAAPVDVDRHDPVIERHFLQGDGNLPAVRRRPVINFNHL
jgi:hypothetical protein